MEKKHFIDSNSNYLGVFLHGATPDVPAIQVPPRPDTNHLHNGSEWVYDEATHWENIRQERDWLLAMTDSLAALPDHPQLQAVLDYRQTLRDLPQAYADPSDVVWPVNPLESE